MKITNFPTGQERRNSPAVYLDLHPVLSITTTGPSAGTVTALTYTPDGERCYKIELSRAEAERIASIVGFVRGHRYVVAIPASVGDRPSASFVVTAFDERHAKELARARYAQQCHGATPAAIHLRLVE